MKPQHVMYSQHNSSKKPEIKQICEDCAAKLGWVIPKGHVYSAWEDICDVCKEYKEVTDPYDFNQKPKI